MNKTVWKLNNPVKNYEWGSKTQITELFSIENSENTTVAELWMGANKFCSSTLIEPDRDLYPLNRLIEDNPQQILGERIQSTYHELPFLFKILFANSPLSIQVHPSKEKAVIGFELENAQNIPLDDSIRNYKDPNHKPELIYAITDFYALNGFRGYDEIVHLFEILDSQVIKTQFTQFKNNLNSEGLSVFFISILQLAIEEKEQLFNDLFIAMDKFDSLTQWAINKIRSHYTNDSGILAPLFLNVICLSPGESMFLQAETLHSYLSGCGLEIMANSDNVIRAGLTNKHINIDELVQNTNFAPIQRDKLKATFQQESIEKKYAIPVDDFKFSILTPNENVTIMQVNSPEILLCIDGETKIKTAHQTFNLRQGDVIFIAFNTNEYTLQGKANIARAFC